MSEKKRVGMFKRKDAGRFRRKPRAITSIPTRSLSKSGEGWENKVYKFKRSFLLSNDSADNWKYGPGCITPGYNPIDLTVMLDKLPNYTDFTTLFDSYRITGVEYRFVPHFNVGQVPLGPQNTQVARLVTVVDKDDNTSLTGSLQRCNMHPWKSHCLTRSASGSLSLCPPSRPTAPLRQPATSLRMLPSGLTWPRRMSRTTVQRV